MKPSIEFKFLRKDKERRKKLKFDVRMIEVYNNDLNEEENLIDDAELNKPLKRGLIWAVRRQSDPLNW